MPVEFRFTGRAVIPSRPQRDTTDRKYAGLDVLSDRATWINFKNRGDLEIVVQGDCRLFNHYGVILVNPVKHPHVKQAEGQAFIDWLGSPEGQQAIADYKIDGQQLFFPDAFKPGA